MPHVMLRVLLQASFSALVFFASTAQASVVQSPCESPALPVGSLHVVIAGHENRTCYTHYLWHMGLTNAHVFVYRRLHPQKVGVVRQGPCGVVVHERLMLPNKGKESAAFHSYIMEHYDRPPMAVLFLHGHGPQGFHADCPTLVGRARLFYRGLAAPSLSQSAAEFSQRMVSLTRVGEPGLSGQAGPLRDFTEDSLTERGSPLHLPGSLDHKNDPEKDKTQASCMALFDKWSVNTTLGGFYTCCASFILPWDRILWYPKQFYREALEFSLTTVHDDYHVSRVCWEYIVWAWYQEPVLTPAMKRLYLDASDLALQFNLSSCAHREPEDSKC